MDNFCVTGTSNNIQPMQLVQTPDGQTFIYQPTPSTSQQQIDQHQIIHQPGEDYFFITLFHILKFFFKYFFFIIFTELK